jgi:hypothetical protein
MNTDQEIADLSEFLNEMHKETDRGVALTAAAVLDDKLAQILKAFLADVTVIDELLLGVNAPLGTFSARICSAYALGLLQKNEYRELNLIRRVRNEFGHSWRGVSFESQRVKHLCHQLPWLGPPEFESTADTRSRFATAVAILMVDLLWRVRLVAKERRVIREWPNKARVPPKPA